MIEKIRLPDPSKPAFRWLGVTDETEGVFDANDAHLLTVGSDEANLGYADPVVNACFDADSASLRHSSGCCAGWRSRHHHAETTKPPLQRRRRPGEPSVGIQPPMVGPDRPEVVRWETGSACAILG